MEPHRLPLPPFDGTTATQKVRTAEDAWNSRDPQRVALGYTPDSIWRNRAEFFAGREAIVQFLTRKWNRELDYRLIKELWTFNGNRIAVRFAYEWHDDSSNWFRSYGNENPGAAAPKLVTNDLVARMKPGSVLVDIAIDQGGCFEDSHATTHADPTY